MSVMKGDFLGFTFNGIHSSELGIMRVSDGSRYTENLLPTIQDKTTQVPGGDGTFYQGSYYTQRQISFPIVFDELTEEQLRRIKQVFGTKGIYELIFDEQPYKVYKVKVTGTPNLKYICFDREEPGTYGAYGGSLYEQQMSAPRGRIYKGEGQLSFVAYTPYATSRFKYIDQYTVANIPEWRVSGSANIYNNKYDWMAASGLLNSQTTKDGSVLDIIDEDNTRIFVANPGDLPTDFRLKFIKKENDIPASSSLKVMIDDNASLQMDRVVLFQGDSGFQINTKLNLIEGIDSNGNLTGTLYNQYITTGDFFKIPQGESFLKVLYMDSAGATKAYEYECTIDYKYLFY